MEGKMQFSIKPQGIWYHGSNKVFEILKEGSTITQWKELAEAFSHKPTILAIDDDNSIFHNGKEYGYLYIVDETEKLFANPRDKRTEDYITGRFG
jgi:ABC-type phosphate transport system ATPase subunit